MKTETKIIIGIVLFTILIIIGSVFLLSNQGQTQSPSQAKPGLGDKALDFDLPSTTGQNIKLSDYKGKKNVLIYFNEGLSCDPCIQQMPELEKSYDEFDKMNVQLLYVTYDQVADLKKAADQYHLKAPILSYFSANTENDYHLLPYSMGMGRRAGHTFVLVDTNGIVKWRKDYWPAVGMSVPGGLMFVNAQEIVNNVKDALAQK